MFTAKKSVQGYDLIGDVHGCAQALERLLKAMGYAHSRGCYRHPKRKVIFVGDIVDRGPRIREALHVVKDMVDQGEAEIVLDRKSTRLNSSHVSESRMPSSA